MHERSIRYVIDEFRDLIEDVKKGEDLEERLKKAADGVEWRMMNNIGEVYSFNAEEILKELKLLCIYKYYKYPNREVKDMIESVFDNKLNKLRKFHKREMKKFPEFGYGYEHEHKNKNGQDR